MLCLRVGIWETLSKPWGNSEKTQSPTFRGRGCGGDEEAVSEAWALRPVLTAQGWKGKLVFEATPGPVLCPVGSIRPALSTLLATWTHTGESSLGRSHGDELENVDRTFLPSFLPQQSL